MSLGLRFCGTRFCMVCDRRGCFLFLVNTEDVGLCLVCEACDDYYGPEAR